LQRVLLTNFTALPPPQYNHWIKDEKTTQVYKYSCVVLQTCDNEAEDTMGNRTFPSSPIMALGSIQSLPEMSTRNLAWGIKVADAQG
jgi:hypothetical protein